MGLELVEFETTPEEELAIKAIQNINKVCQNQVDAAYAKRQMENDRILERYAQYHAKYVIDDILNPIKLPMYLKVETITARLHLGSRIVIKYHGTLHKKVKGEFVPTDDSATLTEDDLVKTVTPA